MKTQDKIIAAVVLTLAVPCIAATMLPASLLAPLALVVPFVASSALESAVRPVG